MLDLFGNVDDEGFYQYMIHRPLSVKVAESIGWIREYAGLALQINPRGYYAAISGGKDSECLKRLFQLAGVPCEFWYNNVTIDPPELIWHLKEHHKDVQWNNPKQHLISMMATSKACGPPIRLMRWCCEIYKEQGGQGRFRSIGVRAPESPRRKATWSFLSSHNKDGLPILCPLIYWTEVDVWQFIYENHIPYCCLYDEVDCRGCKLFKRLGCVGCPLGGPTGQARDFARWPKYEAMWKRGLQQYYDKYKGVPLLKPKKCPQCGGHGVFVEYDEFEEIEVTVTCLRCNGAGKHYDRAIEKFPTVDALWDWWVTGKAYEGNAPDCQAWLW